MKRDKHIITLKSSENIELMKVAGRVCADTLSYLSLFCKPGITGLQLDKMAEEYIRDHGCVPSTIGYLGYKYSICFGINSQVVHCPPTNLPIKEGDLVKIDLVTSYQDWHCDSAITLLVPPIRPEVEKFVETTRRALYQGIKTVREGAFVGDISEAVFKEANSNNYGVVVPFVGHGIGYKEIHQAPQIPNIPQKTKGSMLISGETICIEPICTMTPDASIFYQKDQWETFTMNGSLAAHWEHTILVTETGFKILTLRKGEICA